MAMYFECRINKNALLHTDFLGPAYSKSKIHYEGIQRALQRAVSLHQTGCAETPNLVFM